VSKKVQNKTNVQKVYVNVPKTISKKLKNIKKPMLMIPLVMKMKVIPIIKMIKKVVAAKPEL